jgi:hypothetical protein
MRQLHTTILSLPVDQNPTRCTLFVEQEIGTEVITTRLYEVWSRGSELSDFCLLAMASLRDLCSTSKILFLPLREGFENTWLVIASSMVAILRLMVLHIYCDIQTIGFCCSKHGLYAYDTEAHSPQLYFPPLLSDHLARTGFAYHH